MIQGNNDNTNDNEDDGDDNPGDSENTAHLNLQQNIGMMMLLLIHIMIKKQGGMNKNIGIIKNITGIPKLKNGRLVNGDIEGLEKPLVKKELFIFNRSFIMDTLRKIQNWYYSHCDGEWEHQRGIRIGTLDNPGWSIEINLVGTKSENQSFRKIKIENTEEDWIHCWVEKNNFNAACGPLNLTKTLEIFLKWVKETH